MSQEIIKTIEQIDPTNWVDIFKRPSHIPNIKEAVQAILEDVKTNGDAALRKLTARFDGVHLDKIKFEIPASVDISSELQGAIDQAMSNIEAYHFAQKKEDLFIETMPGIECQQITRPIRSVGLYIPGGSAPLLSTLMMLAIPARIAGCKEIIVCTPPSEKQSSTNPDVHLAIQYIARKLNISTIYQIGGAQAIAAMAFGTETLPKVNKIFGPGNSFVTMAKELIQSEGIAIDMPAGPSEVMVIADNSCIPTFVAADLLSQAEHGPDSQVICIVNSKDLGLSIQDSLISQLNKLPRKDIAVHALAHSCIIIESDLTIQSQLINFYAPEHLILATENFEFLIKNIENAGSIFIGNWSAEAIGDYASGPNHTLPTNGHAKAYSGVNLDAFLKKISVQTVTKEGFKNIANTVEILAETENLIGHKMAVTFRKNYLANA